MYEQCKEDLDKCRYNAHTFDAKLEFVCKSYINTGRSVDTPNNMDMSWIKARIAKLDGVTEEIFLERCKFIKESEELCKTKMIN